jgi:lactoylglutathione lyase
VAGVQLTAALDLLVLRVTDLERSRRFYEALGLGFVEEQHGPGPVHLAATLDSGLVVELYPVAGDASPDTQTRLGFTVGSRSAALSTLRRQGFPVPTDATANDGRRTVVVTDPDGRRVELS